MPMPAESDSNLPGLIVVLSGPAGVGKSTIGERLLAANEDFIRIVTATTRDPRGSEQNGKDYHFLSNDEFQERIEAGRFLEHAVVHSKHYGTPLDAVVDGIRQDKVVLLLIDVDGAEQVREKDLGAFLVFLLPPAREELRNRLISRSTETADRIEKRLERVEKELAAADRYDAKVVNDDLEACVKAVADVIRAKREELAERRAAGEDICPGFADL